MKRQFDIIIHDADGHEHVVKNVTLDIPEPSQEECEKDCPDSPGWEWLAKLEIAAREDARANLDVSFRP